MRISAQTLADIRYEKARRSFAEFARQAWPYLEPTPLEWNWHLDVLAEHLEAITACQITRIIINIPPRTLKSNFINVLWPVWEWGRHPHLKYLTSSYADELSVRDNVKSRDLIKTTWFQGYLEFLRRQGHCDKEGVRPVKPWSLKGDQNVKSRYENTEGGHRIATSVGGSATGDGGDRVMVDDPLSAKGGLSKVKLEEAIVWWDRTMSSRLNDQRVGVKMIVMQRLAESDLTGHVLAQGGYEHLVLPMEYRPTIRINGKDVDTKAYPTSIGYIDPRDEEGEVLFPARFPPAVIADLRTSLGSRGYAGQYQQTPIAEGGNMFKRDWFAIVSAAPAEASRVRYWDKAGTQDGGAYTAGVLISRTADGLYTIENVVRGQWSSAGREAVIKQTAELDALKFGDGVVTTWVEQEPGSGGKESAENTIKNLDGHDVRIERVTGDKVVRATPMEAQAEAGNIRLLKGDWNTEFLDEITVFPGSKYKDQVDAAAGAYNKLALENRGEFAIYAV